MLKTAKFYVALAVALGLGLGVLVKDVMLGQSAAQGANTEVGRYQLVATGANAATVYIMDTKTGRVWYQRANGTWEEQSPAWAKNRN